MRLDRHHHWWTLLGDIGMLLDVTCSRPCWRPTERKLWFCGYAQPPSCERACVTCSSAGDPTSHSGGSHEFVESITAISFSLSVVGFRTGSWPTKTFTKVGKLPGEAVLSSVGGCCVFLDNPGKSGSHLIKPSNPEATYNETFKYEIISLS